MSNAYMLRISEAYPNNAYPIYKGSGEQIDETLDFMHAKSLNLDKDYHLDFKIKTTLNKANKLDVLFTNAFMNVLLSSKAVRILQDLCSDQIQVFDTVIECKDGVLTDYKAINILNEVDVSDPEQRKFYYLTDKTTIAGYERGGFVMKKSGIEPIHIGRDKYSHATIIISSTLKEALGKAKVKGCKYGEG